MVQDALRYSSAGAGLLGLISMALSDPGAVVFTGVGPLTVFLFSSLMSSEVVSGSTSWRLSPVSSAGSRATDFLGVFTGTLTFVVLLLPPSLSSSSHRSAARLAQDKRSNGKEIKIKNFTACLFVRPRVWPPLFYEAMLKSYCSLASNSFFAFLRAWATKKLHAS